MLLPVRIVHRLGSGFRLLTSVPQPSAAVTSPSLVEGTLSYSLVDDPAIILSLLSTPSEVTSVHLNPAVSQRWAVMPRQGGYSGVSPFVDLQLLALLKRLPRLVSLRIAPPAGTGTLPWPADVVYSDMFPMLNVAEVLGDLPQLRSLTLQRVGLGERGALALAEALRRTSNLTALDLSLNMLGPYGAGALAAALHRHPLQALNVSHNPLGAAALAPLAALPALTSLGASGVGLGPRGVPALAHLPATLHTLHLEHNLLGEEGAAALAAALSRPQHAQLQSLLAGSNGIGEQGARALAAALAQHAHPAAASALLAALLPPQPPSPHWAGRDSVLHYALAHPKQLAPRARAYAGMQSQPPQPPGPCTAIPRTVRLEAGAGAGLVFWSQTLTSSNSVTTRWGRSGAAAQAQELPFATAALAAEHFQAAEAAQRRAGYTGAPAAAGPPPAFFSLPLHPPYAFRLHPLRSTVELGMLGVSQAIRAKAGWREKLLHSPSTLAAWRAGALADGAALPSRKLPGDVTYHVNAAAVEHVLQELQWVAQGCGGLYPPGIAPGAVPGTFEGLPGLLPSATLAALQAGVAELEKGPRDEHPGSNGIVRDLVHPSLYCAVLGVSRTAGGEVVGVPALVPVGQGEGGEEGSAGGVGDFSERATGYLSTSHAWLPAEVAVDEAGGATLVSSVNNLDPASPAGAALYPALSQALTALLPLFEVTLSEAASPAQPLHDNPWCTREHMPQVNYGDFDSVPQHLQDAPWLRGNEKEGCLSAYKDAHERAGVPTEESAWEDLYYDCSSDYPLDGPLALPATPPFAPPPARPASVALRGRTLQVIVKLASIELTPAQPVYEGGQWHLEGMANERIVASAVCYLDSLNITPSALAFRVPVEEPVEYPQGERAAVGAAFDVLDEEAGEGSACVQHLGSAATPQGAVLAWPNTLQHRVQPFQLADPAAPGHRKVLVLWLVDPTARIASTGDVPAQQEGWGGVRLPRDAPDPPGGRATLTLGQAQEHRLALMAERAAVKKVDAGEEAEGGSTFLRGVSLCEH